MVSQKYPPNRVEMDNVNDNRFGRIVAYCRPSKRIIRNEAM